MQADVKCLECGKITRRFELGRLFYTSGKPLESAIIEAAVFCPKCGKDVSKGRFSVKEAYFGALLMAASLHPAIGGKIPGHLKGAVRVSKTEYDARKKTCKSRPQFARKF